MVSGAALNRELGRHRLSAIVKRHLKALHREG
jgi:hypothetical protein